MFQWVWEVDVFLCASASCKTRRGERHCILTQRAGRVGGRRLPGRLLESCSDSHLQRGGVGLLSCMSKGKLRGSVFLCSTWYLWLNLGPGLHTENDKLRNLLLWVTYATNRLFCSSEAYFVSVVPTGESGQWAPADNFFSLLHIVYRFVLFLLLLGHSVYNCKALMRCLCRSP